MEIKLKSQENAAGFSCITDAPVNILVVTMHEKGGELYEKDIKMPLT